MTVDEGLRTRREELCMAHMTLENAHDFDGAIGKFARPRYEVVPTGEVYDGVQGLHRFMQETVTGFPDFHYEVGLLHSAQDSIVVEGRFQGRHDGSWRGLPGTGRRVDFPMLIVFPFDGEDMLGERIYFDLDTALHQLGVACDPNTAMGKISIALNHPVTIAKAYLRSLRRRSRQER